MKRNEVISFPLTIIEHSTLSKYGAVDGGEDGLIVTDGYIAIVDGATSKTTPCSQRIFNQRETPGRLARDAILARIKDMPDDMQAFDFMEQLNNSIASLTNSGSIATTMECPQASVIVYSCRENEVWSFGDCACIVDGEVHETRKPIDIALAKKRASVLEVALSNGTTQDELLKNDIGRAAIRDDLLAQSRYANAGGRYGYPVLNGKAIRKHDLVIYHVPKDAEVVLASDGYPILLPTLQQSEAKLREVIEADPLMMNIHRQTKGVYPGQASYDDRSYIRFHRGRKNG